MKTSVNPNIVLLRHKIASNKILKFCLRPMKIVYECYLTRIYNNRNKVFLKNGIPVFKELDEILCSHNINYSITYGSLLGAIRDGGPIKHDLDFDICIWNSDYSEELQSILETSGFRLKTRFLVDNGICGREETYSKNGVDIDFFYVYSDSNYNSYSCCFRPWDGGFTFENSMKQFGYVLVRRLEIPISSTTIRIPFGGIVVNAMDNYEQFLKVCYGEDYKTPDPNYKPVDGDGIRFVWEEKKGVFYKFE